MRKDKKYGGMKSETSMHSRRESDEGMISNEEILRVAVEQSAIDSNCKWEDFFKKENVIVTSVANPAARRYLKLPHVCDLTTYGNNIVATISEEYRDIVESYISKYAVEHCFETPNMHVLNDAFRPHGLGVCFMAEYFLPDMDILETDCPYLAPSPHRGERNS